MPPPSNQLLQQLAWLFLLALPIACVARTVVFEEVFREPREYCKRQVDRSRTILQRKFFYLFTCEYCFSHYVTVFFLWLTGYKLLMDDWRGYVISFFALVLVANFYLNLYGRLRLDIHRERVEIKAAEIETEEKAADSQAAA